MRALAGRGALAATVDAYWTPGRDPRLKVAVNAGSGSFELPQNGGKITADYQALKLFATLDEGLAEARFQLESEQLGRGEIDLQLSLGEKERPVRGRIELSALQLKLLQPLIAPLEDIAGSVDATATLGGTLNQPLLQGTVALTDGLLKGASLPTSLEKIAIQVKFNNAQANISGDLLLGKELAQLEGGIDWQQPPATGWLTVKGARNRFNFEPGIVLLLSPDLRLEYKPELLEITGTVTVPYGRIKIKELPKGAVNRSNDVVIVDAPIEKLERQ